MLLAVLHNLFKVKAVRSRTATPITKFTAVIVVVCHSCDDSFTLHLCQRAKESSHHKTAGGSSVDIVGKRNKVNTEFMIILDKINKVTDASAYTVNLVADNSLYFPSFNIIVHFLKLRTVEVFCRPAFVFVDLVIIPAVSFAKRDAVVYL